MRKLRRRRFVIVANRILYRKTKSACTTTPPEALKITTQALACSTMFSKSRACSKLLGQSLEQIFIRTCGGGGDPSRNWRETKAKLSASNFKTNASFAQPYRIEALIK